LIQQTFDCSTCMLCKVKFAPPAPSCIAQIIDAIGHFTTALECYSIHNCSITAFLLEPLHISSLAAVTNGNHLNPICPANNLQRTFSLFQMCVFACMCMHKCVYIGWAVGMFDDKFVYVNIVCFDVSCFLLLFQKKGHSKTPLVLLF